MLYLFFQWSQQPNVPTLEHEMRGAVSLMKCDELVGGMLWRGDPRNFRPPEILSPVNYSANLKLFLYNPSNERSGMDAFCEGG